MTVPANWCPTCTAACLDNDVTLCTTCGTTLVIPPDPQQWPPRPRSNNNSDASGRLLDAHISHDLVAASRQLRAVLQQVHDTNVDQHVLLQQLQNMRAEWQQLPANFQWDPASTAHRGRPTARYVLDSMPRITVTPTSAVLWQARLHVQRQVGGGGDAVTTTNVLTVPAIPGEWEQPRIDNTTVLSIVWAELEQSSSSNIALTQATHRAIQQAVSRVLLVFARGHGTTFAQMAQLSASTPRHGGGDNKVAAIVVTNFMATPWPYSMRDDSTGLAAATRLPMVMIAKEDGQKLRAVMATATCQARLDIRPHDADCVICAEPLVDQQVVLQLPACQHVFHESCVLPWLTLHNNCPYCRHELPTDDAAYEAERRRRREGQREQMDAATNDFYG